MDGKKSKFEYDVFEEGYHHFMVNAGKYTKEEAEEIYKREQAECDASVKPYICELAAVKWSVGKDINGEPCVGWWSDYSHDGTEPRICPAWGFRREG